MSHHLWGGLCQNGLSLRRGGHRAHVQAVGLQLRDGGEEGGPRQRGTREMGRGAVHLFVAPEIKGNLFADGGRPGAPFVLNGCESEQSHGMCATCLIEKLTHLWIKC